MTPSSTGISNNWYKNGTLFVNKAPATPTVLTAPTVSTEVYTIRTKGANGCLSAPSNSVNALINAAPTPTITSNPASATQLVTLCVLGGTNGSALLTANSPTATYSWKLAGNYIVGANANTYTAAVTTMANNKVFTVEATYPNGCVKTSVNKQVRLVTSGCTPRMGEGKGGHDLINMETTLSNYPNPTDGFLQVEVENAIGNEGKIVLYNPLGQVVFTQTSLIEGGKVSVQLELSSLAAGIYSLVFTDEKGEYTQKVMKN